MSRPTGQEMPRGEKELRFWRGLAAGIVALGLLGWLGGSKVLEAQSSRGSKEDRTARVRMEFRQTEAVYNRIADVIGDWEGKGWETYQVVPVYPANPGVGGAMTVALVFRRPTK